MLKTQVVFRVAAKPCACLACELHTRGDRGPGEAFVLCCGISLARSGWTTAALVGCI